MKVKFFAHMRNCSGCKEADLPDQPDVYQLLHYLSDCYGKDFRNRALSDDGTDLGNDIIVLINGRDIRHIQGIKSTLKSEDTVLIFSSHCRRLKDGR